MKECGEQEDAARTGRLKERYLSFQVGECGSELLRIREADAVTWREATNVMFSPEPFYQQLNRGGRWAREGETLPDSIHHGFDSAGDVVLIRSLWTHVFLRTGELTEEIRFRDDGTAHALHHYYTDGSRMVRHYEVSPYGLMRVDYAWEGDRLARSVHDIIRAEYWFEAVSALSMPVVWSQYVQRTYEYDPDGQLGRILLWGLSEPFEVEFQRPKKKETAASLSREIEELLVRNIPPLLKSARVGSPLYCVYLAYCSSGWNLLPTLCLANESDRSRFDLGEGAFDTESVWSTAELSEAAWLELDDPALPERWNIFCQLMRQAEDFSHGPGVLQRVARRLNGMDWTGVFPHSIDFVFTASDTEDGIDYRQDLKKSVLPSQQALLKKRGLWP